MKDIKKEIKRKKEIQDLCISMCMNSGLRIAEIGNQLISASIMDIKNNLGHETINTTINYIKK
jgi:hypothetical protein